jgi:diguanylate cyclase (GGDEF)-like protein
MLPFTRAALAVMVSSLAVIAILQTFSPTGPHGTAAATMTWLGGLGGLASALLWIMRWPSKAQSVVLTIAATANIALVCLAQSDPLVGLMGCTAFVTAAGYIAFLHTAPYILYNFVVAAAVAGIEAVRLASTGRVIIAVTLYWLVLVLNTAVPFGIQTVVHALGVDLLRSDRDPLTGLLNRRAFYRRLAALITANRMRGDCYLAVAMLDLDRFKTLNDTEGHAAGDLALVAVGQALRDNSPDTTLIGRTGGEEFLIAHTSASPDISAMAKRLCTAVASIPGPITTSVGTVSVDFKRIKDRSPEQIIDRLVTEADAAMYAAKRKGGNQVAHSAAIVKFD